MSASLIPSDKEFLLTLSELSDEEVFIKSEIPSASYGEELRFSKLAKYELDRRSSSKRDAREEITLSIAKRANIIAISAIIFSIITAIIITVIQLN